MQEVDKLQLIREKIIRTDEVLKLLLQKKSDLEKLNTKYQVVLNKYLEKCKHLEKLKQECESICINNDEQQTKILSLEEELNLCQSEHAKLQTTYVEYVNTAQLEYQNINLELSNSQKKVKEHEKQISLLETELAKAKQTCHSCNNTIKTAHQQESGSVSTSSESGGSPRKNRKKRKRKICHLEYNHPADLQPVETCTEDVNKIREEAEAKIFSLENKLSLVKLDNMNLRNDMKRLENDCGTLRSENITLKTNLKEVHNKSEKLQEKINAMTLEIEVMNFNDTQKGGSCDIGIQAEITDDGSDLASIIVDGFCEELSCIPRIISPLEDVLCENDICEPHESLQLAFDGNCPPLDGNFCSADNQIASETRGPNDLNINVASDECGGNFTAFMQGNGVEEPSLLGFLPVQGDDKNTKNIPPRNKRRRKRPLGRYDSDQIYRRVLRDVLKYFRSGKKNCVRRRRGRMKCLVVGGNRKREKPRKSLEKVITLSCGDASTTSDCNALQHSTFCYDVPPSSVDSGYSAQMSTESECSEIIACKFSSDENSCAFKNKKLQLFGSESESDSEMSQQGDSSLQCIESCDSVHRKIEATKRSKSNVVAHVYSKERLVFKRPNCKKKVVGTPQSLESIKEEKQLPIIAPLNEIKHVFVENEQPNSEKRVFKRPNCRKRAIESPRSPEPVKEVKQMPEKPVIIPLNKPKKLSSAIVNNLFKKLLTYPEEPQILEEVADKMSNQEPAFISKAILEVVACDYNSKVEKKENPFAPLLSEKQMVLLGFIVKLEIKNVSNIVPAFLIESERCILQEKSIERIIPLTRLHLAVCKMKRDVYRMRKMCLDALYFMDDLVIPFLYTVLTSWAEVLPPQSECTGSILPKVIVQVINLKSCNFPGYNLMNLRTVISKLHGYPSERWNSDELFSEMVTTFKENAGKPDLEVGILIFCKNHPASWVADKLEKLTDDVLSIENSLLRTRTVELMGQIIRHFDSTTDAVCIKRAEECRNRLLI